MGSPESVESDASNSQQPYFDQKPYYTFRPQVEAEYPVTPQAVQVRSATRLQGAITLAVAATVALVHGIYFTFDDHPVQFPFLNQITVVIAVFAYYAASMAFRGRHYFIAIAGPLSLILVMVWDLSMQFLCYCAHQPLAGFILIPLIGISGRFIFQTRSEFLD